MVTCESIRRVCARMIRRCTTFRNCAGTGVHAHGFRGLRARYASLSTDGGQFTVERISIVAISRCEIVIQYFPVVLESLRDRNCFHPLKVSKPWRKLFVFSRKKFQINVLNSAPGECYSIGCIFSRQMIDFRIKSTLKKETISFRERRSPNYSTLELNAESSIYDEHAHTHTQSACSRPADLSVSQTRRRPPPSPCPACLYRGIRYSPSSSGNFNTCRSANGREFNFRTIWKRSVPRRKIKRKKNEPSNIFLSPFHQGAAARTSTGPVYFQTIGSVASSDCRRVASASNYFESILVTSS